MEKGLKVTRPAPAPVDWEPAAFDAVAWSAEVAADNGDSGGREWQRQGEAKSAQGVVHGEAASVVRLKIIEGYACFCGTVLASWLGVLDEERRRHVETAIHRAGHCPFGRRFAQARPAPC